MSKVDKQKIEELHKLFLEKKFANDNVGMIKVLSEIKSLIKGKDIKQTFTIS